MSSEAEEKAIHERLMTAWGSRTPIKFGDMKFTEPTGDNRQFIAVFIQGQEARQIDIGTTNPLIRNPGFVVVQIFGGQDKGNRPLKRLADIVRTIFQRVTIILPSNQGTIRFGVATVREQPAMNTWAQVNVDIPFNRDSRDQ